MSCVPCPQKGWRSWQVDKCVNDVARPCSDRPSLCRSPDAEWQHVAGSEICDFKTTTPMFYTGKLSSELKRLNPFSLFAYKERKKDVSDTRAHCYVNSI